MATLTITIDPGTGPVSETLTFSGADATRIINAFRKDHPSGTVAQLVDYFAMIIKTQISKMVISAEAVTPIPPVMS